MNERMIARLKELAERNCFHDDENDNVIVDDYAGGNVDDAFDLGERAGETLLARYVLNELGISWGDE